MRYLSMLFVLLFLFGCGNKQKIATLQKENADLKEKVTQISEQTQQKDQFIEEFTSTLNEVYENLEKIRQKESLIGRFSKNIEKNRNVSVKEKILDDIQSIENYLESSKKKLNRFKNENYQNLLKRTDLEKTVENLTKTLQEKETEIASLKEQLSQANIQMASYVDSLKEKEEIIVQQGEKMNTVYYVIGTEKELKEKGIIEEKGGILGIRKAKTLAPTLNRDFFQKSDMTQIHNLEIDRPAKGIRIISPHNPDSYHLSDLSEKKTLLEISNPEEFWKIQYLVIVTKG